MMMPGSLLQQEGARERTEWVRTTTSEMFDTLGFGW